MLLSDFLKMKPQFSGDAGANILANMISQEGWGWYKTGTHPAVEELAGRFLRSHALIPGLITETTYGVIPMETFECEAVLSGSTVEVRGGYFLNGGVSVWVFPDGEQKVWLFVDRDTIETWGYPPTEQGPESTTTQEGNTDTVQE